MLSAEAPRVLLVEDDPATSEAVSSYLSRDGLVVEAVNDGLIARERLTSQPDAYGLFVIDLKLPGLSGERLCLAARSVSDAPIIVVSGKAGIDAAVTALELGADDFLAKPFSPRELVSRARAKLRAADGKARADKPEFGGISLDRTARKAFMAGRELNLGRAEFNLLSCLVSCRERYVRVDELARAAKIAPHSVAAAIRKLNSKLRCPDARIEHVVGRGYHLRATGDEKGNER